MKVILLTPLASAKGSFSVGDEYECSKDEAKRFIDRGLAKAAPKKTAKKKAKK